MLCAISATDTGPGNGRCEPSGKRTFNMMVPSHFRPAPVREADIHSRIPRRSGKVPGATKKRGRAALLFTQKGALDQGDRFVVVQVSGVITLALSFLRCAIADTLVRIFA
jgi:hypothetical protein